MKRLIVPAVVAVALVALAGPANAKGRPGESGGASEPTEQAVITGPGLSEPLEMGGSYPVDDLAFGYRGFKPTDGADLGPRYTVAITVEFPDTDLSPTVLTQYLYPYAPDGPWTLTLDQGELFGGSFSYSPGWTWASPVLLQTLRSRGLPETPPVVAGPGGVPNTLVADDLARRLLIGTGIALGLVLAIAAAVSLAARRNRVRAPIG